MGLLRELCAAKSCILLTCHSCLAAVCFCPSSVAAHADRLIQVVWSPAHPAALSPYDFEGTEVDVFEMKLETATQRIVAHIKAQEEARGVQALKQRYNADEAEAAGEHADIDVEVAARLSAGAHLPPSAYRPAFSPSSFSVLRTGVRPEQLSCAESDRRDVRRLERTECFRTLPAPAAAPRPAQLPGRRRAALAGCGVLAPSRPICVKCTASRGGLQNVAEEQALNTEAGQAGYERRQQSRQQRARSSSKHQRTEKRYEQQCSRKQQNTHDRTLEPAHAHVPPNLPCTRTRAHDVEMRSCSSIGLLSLTRIPCIDPSVLTRAFARHVPISPPATLTTRIDQRPLWYVCASFNRAPA